MSLNNGSQIALGDSGDLFIVHDGTNGKISNSTGSLSINTDTEGAAVNIGHSTSEVNIGDNLVVNGNTTIEGDLTVNGSLTSINTTNYNVNDRLIKLGDGNLGSSHDLGIIFTRGDGGLSNVGNKLFIWDESEDTFALVSADIDGNGNDPSINHLNNYAPLSISDLKATKGVFSSDTTVGGDMSINGSLTVGGMAVTSTEIGLLDGITTIGVSQNEKVLTQNSDGVVTIGQSNANQVLNIASHDGVDGGLKLNNELVLSSAAELNKLNGTVDGTVSQNKAVIADANKDIAGINNLSI